MENYKEELEKLESEFKARNQDVDEQVEISDKSIENSNNSNPSSNDEATKPQMTQEQANAVMNIAKNPKEFLGVKVSQKMNDLLETDDNVKEQFTDLAKDTVQQAINTYDTENKKQSKQNFFDLNEKDVISMGGDKTSTKGQQFSIVLIKRFFWILFMATLGTFCVAPLSVVLELFQGISFKNVEREEYSKDGEKKTLWVIKKHKMGIAGTILGWIIGIGFLVAEGFLIARFPKVFLFIAIGVFAVLLIINIAGSVKWRSIFRKINKMNEENGNSTTTEEVEQN